MTTHTRLHCPTGRRWATAAALVAAQGVWQLACAQQPAASASAPASAPPASFTPSHWVAGSWVNVRAEPSRTAKVQGNWTVNTPLVLLQRQNTGKDEWCLAQAGPEAWSGAQLTGWVLCTLTAPQAAKPPELPGGKRPLWSDSGPRDSLRDFWLAPTAGRLRDAAVQFTNKLLTSEQRHSSELNARLPVYPVPEFNAMKRLLAQAAVPAIDTVTWPPEAYLGQTDQTTQAAALLRWLPTPPSSLFTQRRQVVGFGEMSADVAWALSAAPAEISYYGQPAWEEVPGDGHFQLFGMWDIAGVRLRLSQPIYHHQVARNGLVSATTMAEFTEEAEHPGARCVDPPPTLPERPVPGYPKVSEVNRLTDFYLPQALGRQKVDIASTKRPLPPEVLTGLYQPKNVASLHAIDLNRDALPDLMVVELFVVGNVSEQPTVISHHFLNLAGQWRWVGVRQEQECT